MSKQHAILSASGVHRWLSCTPSARLELEFDDISGEAAFEGTAAHNLSEHKLRIALNIKSDVCSSDLRWKTTPMAMWNLCWKP